MANSKQSGENNSDSKLSSYAAIIDLCCRVADLNQIICVAELLWCHLYLSMSMRHAVQPQLC